MRKYERQNRPWLAGALICTLISSLLAVALQFFKGGVLARALLRDTELLILDEPLANLDGGTAERIEDLLLSIRDRTLLVVSHQFSPGKLAQFDQVADMAAGG